MPTATIVRLDPLLGAAGAAAMVDLCHRFGSYPTYSEESVESPIGRGLSQRHDAALNFVRSGGRFGRKASVAELAARTNYFRAEYAYGESVLIDGIEPFLHHESFIEAARAVHGRPVIEPSIVYANILVPAQELAVHTDVPEFRGANRKVMPQWLIVAMHHSRLFDEHRMPIATAVSWWSNMGGGEFVAYPDGADGAPVAHPAGYDTAMVLDTDTVFHGVDMVASSAPLPPLRPGMTLDFVGDRNAGGGSGRTWAVHDGLDEVVRYDWDELRFSVSWKAYCFEDEHERAMWREHADDLSLDTVVDRLVADLRTRGRLEGDVPGDPDLALMIIDEYIRFPEPAA